MAPRLGTDSAILAAARLITYAVGIASAMVLARGLDLSSFGDYAQGTQIVTIAALVTALGLVDGVNFFQNRGMEQSARETHINTVVTVQVAVGLLVSMTLLVFQRPIAEYYGNPDLIPLFVYLAFRPLLMNLISSLQVLLLSVSRAKFIAIRTIVFSALKLVVVIIVTLSVRDVRLILASMVIMDALTVAWFWHAFGQSDFSLRLVFPRWQVMRPVLQLCLPMGIYVAATSVSRELGKLVIGGRSTVEWYAIYANCATPLPFEVVSSSFLVVMIPLLTSHLANSRLKEAGELLRNYVGIGYLTSFTLVMACLAVAPEALRFLYGEQYSAGLPIFQLNLVGSLLQFLNLSLVLSASGNTKYLMWLSLISLTGNAVLSYFSFDLLGVLGPAASSCMISLLTSVWLFAKGSRVVGASTWYLLGGARFAWFLAASAGVFCAASFLRVELVGVGVHYLVVLASCGALYVGLMLGSSVRHLRASVWALNHSG